jgi:hypothetical protein
VAEEKEEVEAPVAVTAEAVSVSAEPATKESTVPAAEGAAECTAPPEPEAAKAQEETPKA